MHVGILGGTGPAGRALGCRIAAAGIEVTLGSRDQVRAEAAAAELLERWPGRDLKIKGGDNAAAADAEVVVLGTPWDAALTTVQPLRDRLAGKVVISMASALIRVGHQVQAVTLARGSVAGTLQAALPASLITGAFHHLPAEELRAICCENAAALYRHPLPPTVLPA